ncbi:hypothetical protein B0H16DRAFT_124006 [Mycena metata]|uniref:DUF6534 domain-containing protein n=1 Tax=Mycena metata TaxID=1033252 RepID=A0AAD7I6H4_9AGAR|nr:hypothetical protein B0H16DRAFT_124006 [Mycena metata]
MIPYGLDSPLILGVMEIGVFFSLILFGVVAVQTYVYFNNCRSDRAGLKLLVGAVFFFELCHSIMACHALYYFTVELAGIPELEKPANSYSLSLTPVFETIITALVQGFFGYRLRLLSGRLSLSIVCWLLCFLRVVGGMAVAVEGFIDVPLEPDYFHLQDTYGWVITSALFVGAALDILITVSLCFYIRMLYTSYNLPRSEEVIHRLITWTIQTGLLTGITSVAVAIAVRCIFLALSRFSLTVVLQFQTMKHNFIWLALYTFLAKFYSNSLLVSLNARPQHREIIRAPSPKSWDASPYSTRPSTPNMTIQITRTTEVEAQTLVSLQVPERTAYNNAAYKSV